VPRQGKGQKVQVPTGLQYGDAKALGEAQAQLPLADNKPEVPNVAAGRGLADILGSAQAGPTPVAGGLARPSNRPNEPVTAGMRRGLGPGPEALKVHINDPATDVLEMIASTTGDPIIASMARRARQRRF
jgi:hypothetical protein